MKLKKIPYEKLKAKQQENYNFQKLAAILADYGFNCIRLSDDWMGADFLAVHINGKDILKVQLKGALTIQQAYLGKDIHIAFPSRQHQDWYLIPHDELVAWAKEKTNALNGAAWKTGKKWYRWPRLTPKMAKDLEKLNKL